MSLHPFLVGCEQHGRVHKATAVRQLEALIAKKLVEVLSEAIVLGGHAELGVRLGDAGARDHTEELLGLGREFRTEAGVPNAVMTDGDALDWEAIEHHGQLHGVVARSAGAVQHKAFCAVRQDEVGHNVA
eukprot:4475983-Pleurochrysis_carterae.AAC.1